MSGSWEVHHAPYGIWFVLLTDAELEVIAPPGIRVTLDEGRDHAAPGLLPGWRRVTLPNDDDLDPEAIDDADAVCVSTKYVLDRMGPEWASEIKRIMIAQLSIAAALAQTEDGTVDDDSTSAGSRGVIWALGELQDAFPNERWELAKGLACAECGPHVCADLLPETGTADIEPGTADMKTKPMRSIPAAMPAQTRNTSVNA